MLSNFLESTYNRYKNDTSTFVRWLFETGQACGYTSTTALADAENIDKKENKPVKAPRLKGKARKEAKEEKQGPSNSTPKDAQPEQKSVPLSQLLPLANKIVNCKEHSVTIPTEVIRAGLRAISARKRSVAYFISNTKAEDAETKQSNQSHSYIVSLLEEVIMTLQPCFATRAASAAQNESTRKPPSIEELQNRFATLEVEEPLEQTGTEGTQQAKTSVESIYDVEPPKNEKQAEEEKLFALFCLFDDLQDLRKFIQRLWKEFATKQIDLVTASVTTNAAFQLAIQTQDEVLAAYPECGDYQSVLAAMIDVYEVESTDALEREVPDVVVDWIFAPAHSILDNFCDVLMPNQVPMMKRGHFGVYNPVADRRKMSDTQQQQEDMILLLEILPEFAFMQRYNVSLFASDELTRGLVKMVETKQIPIWLAFATTVLLDIHHMLRGQVSIALNELQAVGRYVKDTLDRYFEFTQSIPAPSSVTKSNELLLRGYSKGVSEKILKDIILPIKIKHHKTLGKVPPGASEEFYLYKRQPILCGILAFRATLELQSAGVIMCDSWGTITYPAHFYNALRWKADSVKAWPMMDKAMAIHTEERLFVGSPPKTLEESFKQACLILGISVSNFAQNRRNTGSIPLSKNGPRGLKDGTVLGDFFKADLAGRDSSIFTLGSVEKLLNEESKIAELASDPKNKALRREWATTKCLTPLQFLEALKQFMPSELPKIDFNYFRMHEQSVELLRRLRVELDPDLRKYFGPMYIKNESQLPLVGLYIIVVAYQSSKIAKELRLGEVVSIILEKAGSIFEAFIDEQED